MINQKDIESVVDVIRKLDSKAIEKLKEYSKEEYGCLKRECGNCIFPRIKEHTTCHSMMRYFGIDYESNIYEGTNKMIEMLLDLAGHGEGSFWNV